MSERIASTYVSHDGREYLVSTINRGSSAYGYGMYSETMVWPVDGKRQRTQSECVAQGDGPEGSLGTHFRFVEEIAMRGIKSLETKESAR